MTKPNLYSLPKDPAYIALIEDIKSKPELANLPDSFVSEILDQYIKKNNIMLPLSTKSSKLLVKDIRAILRLRAGRFRNSEEQLSSKERIDSYEYLRKLIENIKPRSILDLGCGTNPLYLSQYGVKYYAYDIQGLDIKQVQAHFKKHNIEGEAKIADITKMDFPKTDLTLILKVLDVLDVKNHKPSEELLKKVPSRHIIVSFSTKTLSGKPMNHPQRGWIERLCDRLNYSFKLVTTKNELFYIIEKH